VVIAAGYAFDEDARRASATRHSAPGTRPQASARPAGPSLRAEDKAEAYQEKRAKRLNSYEFANLGQASAVVQNKTETEPAAPAAQANEETSSEMQRRTQRRIAAVHHVRVDWDGG